MYNIINKLFLILISIFSIIIVESLYYKKIEPNFLYEIINCTENIEKLNLHFNALIIIFFLISIIFKRTNLRNSYLNLILIKVIASTMKIINNDVLNFTTISFLIIIINFIFGCFQIKKLQKISSFLIFYSISRLIILKYEKKMKILILTKKLINLFFKY